MTRPWPAGATTGLGSLPGVAPSEAAKFVLSEVGGLPYLPELPDRGLGADMIGRTAALLVDLPVEWQPHGWTMASARGRDAGRARDWLRWDVDAFADLAQGAPVVKVQLCGPMTLAAAIELPNLHKLLTDHGAVADLTASLAEGAAQHVADLAQRLPGTAIVLQLDEPSLPAVLSGQIPTPSGYGTVRSIDQAVAGRAMTAVLAAAEAGRRIVHCCAADVPLELLRIAGADGIAVDLSLLTNQHLDVIGELIDGGLSMWLGIVPGSDRAGAPITFDAARGRLDDLWNRLGFERELLATSVVPTPACGLAGASPDYVRRVAAVLADVGEWLLQ